MRFGMGRLPDPEVLRAPVVTVGGSHGIIRFALTRMVVVVVVMMMQSLVPLCVPPCRRW
jgi:hypothetical protein